MFHSLANRLTLWYAGVAVGLVVVVAATYTFMGFASVASGANQSIAQASHEAGDLIAITRVQHRTLRQDAPKIAAELSRGFMRVSIFDDAGRLIGGANPADNQRHRAVLALMSFFGVVPSDLKVAGGLVFIGPEPTRMELRLRRFWQSTIIVSLIVAIIVWFAFRGITRRALRPLVDVTNALQHFGSGDFKSRFIIDPGNGDEMAALTQAYNSAVDQVSAAFEERRKVEMQISQFIADAGHQLRTPLTVVMGFIEVLRKGAARDPQTEGRIFDAMTVESRRMRTLIDKLVFLARLERSNAIETSIFDLTALTAGVVESFKQMDGGERLSLQADAHASVAADKTEIHEAISNLIDNALKYAPQSPVNVRVAADNGKVLVDVQDFGPGIAADEQHKIFDRFYRGAPAGGIDGSGLGLAIVRRAVERANGQISVKSTPGAGTTFEIELPRVA